MRRFGLFLCILAAACDGASTTTVPTPTTTRPDGVPSAAALPPAGPVMTGRVIEVLDGDSVIVDVSGDPIEVRLLGVNAPEREECFGDQARAALAGLALGQEVTLSGEDFDQFGRLLAYVDRADIPLGISQLTTGHGLATSIDHPRSPSYVRSESAAAAAGRGMWSPAACGEAPLGAVFIVLLLSDAPGADGDNLNGEVVVIANEGESIDLSGWILRDESTRWRFRFPDGLILGPEARVSVRTGCEEPGVEGIYWCASDPVWNNDGDTALLMDANGNVIDRFVYGLKSN